MSLTHHFETIAAIATPRGTGGVAIIRLSGKDSWGIAKKLSTNKKDFSAGQISHGWCIDPDDEKQIDEVLFLAFKAPHSYTGEDAIEIQCHGGLVISKMILEACFKLGAKPAEAGEFTKRALLNGRLDLTQAESVLDLIHAQGEALVKLSANNLHHRSLAKCLEHYLNAITEVQADLTASIDFPDEVGDPDLNKVITSLEKINAEISLQLEQNKKRQVIRNGITVAIIGLPNAGKSSLFNALLTEERAIVTDIAGTTRDVLRETISLNGIPLTLVDTAGLRKTEDKVEVLGVERSWQALEDADAIMYIFDTAAGITAEDNIVLEKLNSQNVLIVANKCDLKSSASQKTTGKRQVTASTQTGEGIVDILDWLAQIAESIPDSSNLEYLLSERQLSHLETVSQEINLAIKALQTPGQPFDLATVPLTAALLELQGLLGKDTTELVLDSVFSRFCVGK